ncbi:hypothetical protein LguiB_000897 [Lonicera macranthoides]
MGYYEEHFQRFWKSKEMPNYLNIHAKTVPTGFISVENSPPWAVMAYAIQAHNLTDSLYIPVDFPSQTPLQAYFVFYFLDPLYRFYPDNLTSKVEIYIDDKKVGASVVPNGSLYYDMCRMVSLYPVQVSGSANVTIAPAEGSTLPPILNAMEVFSNIDLSKGGRKYDFSALSTVFLLLVWERIKMVRTLHDTRSVQGTSEMIRVMKILKLQHTPESKTPSPTTKSVGQHTLNRNVASDAMEKSYRLQFRSNLRLIRSMLSEVNLNDRHKEVLERTPFWKMLQPFVFKMVEENSVTKSDDNVIQLVKCYDR